MGCAHDPPLPLDQNAYRATVGVGHRVHCRDLLVGHIYVADLVPTFPSASPKRLTTSPGSPEMASASNSETVRRRDQTRSGAWIPLVGASSVFPCRCQLPVAGEETASNAIRAQQERYYRQHANIFKEGSRMRRVRRCSGRKNGQPSARDPKTNPAAMHLLPDGSLDDLLQ